ncbi:adenosine deaminase-like protein isoform X5 [Zalophus californianus]|uniref:Adenosine deaminase-like protein isoform X5 n=1 Tax=Zalophus californianus TaxID=9704 RepID=A0A6J2B6E4_ZALCA|nr:adenosine deaminase-like protein isoform X5 [Zalophus californianus]
MPHGACADVVAAVDERRAARGPRNEQRGKGVVHVPVCGQGTLAEGAAVVGALYCRRPTLAAPRAHGRDEGEERRSVTGKVIKYYMLVVKTSDCRKLRKGKLSPELHIQVILSKCMDIKQSEGNSRPQNLLTEAHCTVHNKNKSIWRKTFLFCEIMMEAEEHQQPRKAAFYSELPKVELHAHLNGSISSNTMKKLIAKKPGLKIHDQMTLIDKGKKTLEECFQMFQIIHQLTTSPEDILMVTKDVIKEFADDGVKYLELRSTPRRENATGMTKKAYVESVLEGIKQSKQENIDIDVRYLIAIDRRGGPSVAKETVKLAEEFFLSSDDTVLGLDLSGDPTIPNQKKETQVLLDLLPDRIGHGTFLNSSEGGSLDLVDFVRQHQIPLELCLTSNIKSQTVPSYDQHHFGFWYSIAHPSVICTDDKGVFATHLSEEYQLAAETFNLTQSQVWDLSYESIDYIFASDRTRSELRRKWNHLKPKVLHF